MGVGPSKRAVLGLNRARTPESVTPPQTRPVLSAAMEVEPEPRIGSTMSPQSVRSRRGPTPTWDDLNLDRRQPQPPELEAPATASWMTFPLQAAT
jgi:hypothetical protein